MSTLRSIQYTSKSQKDGNRVHFYKGVDDTTTDAQYALISASKAGTDGVLAGIIAEGGREVTDTNATPDGAGVLYAGTYGTWGQPSNVAPGAVSVALGAPILAASDTDYILATTAITALPITGVRPDVGRCITLTGNATSVSVITVSGLDMEGKALSVSYTLNGTNAVVGTKAFGVGSALTFTLVTPHTGDTFIAGVATALGLPFRLSDRSQLPKGCCTLGGTIEGTEPTVTIDASNIENNTISLATALDGSKVVVVSGIRSYSPTITRIM